VTVASQAFKNWKRVSLRSLCQTVAYWPIAPVDEVQRCVWN
jgi:hypothetical protein